MAGPERPSAPSPSLTTASHCMGCACSGQFCRLARHYARRGPPGATVPRHNPRMGSGCEHRLVFLRSTPSPPRQDGARHPGGPLLLCVVPPSPPRPEPPQRPPRASVANCGGARPSQILGRNPALGQNLVKALMASHNILDDVEHCRCHLKSARIATSHLLCDLCGVRAEFAVYVI